jgi:hypothetical protein
MQLQKANQIASKDAFNWLVRPFTFFMRIFNLSSSARLIAWLSSIFYEDGHYSPKIRRASSFQSFVDEAIEAESQKNFPLFVK